MRIPIKLRPALCVPTTLIVVFAAHCSLGNYAVAEAPLTTEEANQIAREAYVYAYPLLLTDLTRAVGTNTEHPSFPNAPINQFAHARAFPDPPFTTNLRLYWPESVVLDRSWDPPPIKFVE